MLIVPAEAPDWLADFAQQIETEIEINTRQIAIPVYTVSTLPSATLSYSGNTTLGYSKWIFVTDETGGAVPAFTDGAAWRRCTDRTIVS
jgi:hypothetical protein|tara:strand:+ start:5266 stop:5532 length:267 start_codon:yes stop_codon:yes gene_type:complete